MPKVYFNNSRTSEIKTNLLSAINNAQFEINIMVYFFTDVDIVKALKNFVTKSPLTKLNIIIDKESCNFNKNPETDEYIIPEAIQMIQDLQDKYPQQVKLKIYNTSGIMHHKMIIIDRYYFGTGSYNFTSNADSNNYENFLFFTADHDPYTAKKILKEFFSLMDIYLEFEKMYDLNVKTIPVIERNGKIIHLSDEDTMVFLYPLKVKFLFSGNNIMMIKVYTDQAHAVPAITYFNSFQKNNSIILSFDFSQYIYINFIGWDGDVEYFKKFICIDRKPILSSNHFENFYQSQMQILNHFETFVNKMDGIANKFN